MRERHLQWGAQALWSQLEPLLPGLSVEVLARSPSTNSELLERARIVPPGRRGAHDDAAAASPHIGRRQADVQPSLLVAEQQTAGRGRMGRGWRAARGASLTFSLALPLAPLEWSGLSLAVGVALAEALQPAAGTPLRLGVKWPNDLWVVDGASPTSDAASGLANGRKLGGVLIETVAAGKQRLAVIGIGINVAPLPEPLPPDLQDRLACLRDLHADMTAPAALARVAMPLVQALKAFERDGFAAFEARFAALDLLRGEAIVTTDPALPEGVARGVDAQGSLCVEVPGGTRLVSSGEVSVRPAAASPPVTA